MIRIARFALGRPLPPNVRQTVDGFVANSGQVSGTTKRLVERIDEPLERWASRANIKAALPTLGRGELPRFRQQNAKDKLIGLIRKVQKRSGKVYWSKPQRERMAIESAMIPGKKRIKALADNYDGKF